jgi:hypothetical protein
LNVLKIEEILIKLVNRETSRKSNASTSKNEQSQKNKAFATKKRDQSADNKGGGAANKNKKRCFNCNSLNYPAKNC